jgi:RNA polymerase sigma-70 factor (ECF subfamily)
MSERPHEDLRLVARMLRGEEAAFDAFIDEYYPKVYRFAYRRVGADAESAQDVVQGTFEKVFPKLSYYRGEAALFSWLCAFCRYEIAAFWAARARIAPQVELTDDLPEVRGALESLARTQDGPESDLERKELARLVRVALDHLPSRYSDVLEWKYLRDLSVREIAERLDLTPKAAESLLTRARDAFRDGFAALAGRWTPS